MLEKNTENFYIFTKQKLINDDKKFAKVVLKLNSFGFVLFLFFE